MPGLKEYVRYPSTESGRLQPNANESFASDGSNEIGEPFADTLKSFRSRINCSTVGIALYDKKWQCMAVNAAFATMHNVSAHLGKTVHQIVGEEILRVEPIFRRVWETGNPFSNVLLTTQPLSSAEKARWLLNLYPIKDASGQVCFVAIAFSEVTRRSNVESQLSRLTSKLQPDASGNFNVLGEEFTQRSARTLDLVKRSVELLKCSMSLRCCVFEARLRKEFARQALFLSGTRPQTSLFRPFLRRRGSEAVPASRPSANNQGDTPAGNPSPRERQILHLLADGNSNKEIGTLLKISTRTVEFYRARIMLKLDLHSTAALVRYAIRNNIVEA
jgi:DNA-binding CsgD family transcriptional regulator